MPKNQHSFVIPDTQDISELVSMLDDNFTIRVQPETISYREFYDTFDWRLYKNGSALEMHEDNNVRKIYWRAGKKAALKIQLGLKQVPPLASELPQGDFREQLQSVVSVRELIPCIKVRIKRLPVAVLGNDEKVVVRLSFDVYRYSPSRLRASQVLGRRMSINAVKGYAKYFQQVEALVQKMKLQPAQDNILKLAMAAKGTSAGDYTTRLLFLLDPETTTEAALKVILQQLLEIMQQNTSGCIRGIDVEYLHDYSNALKKTCYVIKQFHEAIPQAVREKHDEFFIMVNQLATAVREKDLHLLRLQEQRKNQKKSVKKNIDCLQENLLHAREEAHQRLKEVLKSPEYRENIGHWREYLKSVEKSDSAGKTVEPVYRRVDEVIWQLYQQALEESSSFAGSGDIKKLHQLHAMLEKLGYLLEFFRSLYPAASMHLLIKELNGMRDRMTGFVELDEYVSAVQPYIKQLDNKKDRKAVKKIIKKQEKQLADSATELADIHETFSSSYYRDKFREMFIDYHHGQ